LAEEQQRLWMDYAHRLANDAAAAFDDAKDSSQ
jgi:hypothetical protein